MRNVIDVSAESRFIIARKKIRKTVEDKLRALKIKGPVYLEVKIVGNRKMKQLNKTFADNKDLPVVLSFALEDPHENCQKLRIIRENTKEDVKKKVIFAVSPDGILRLGSVVISYPQARDLAAEDEVLVDEKIAELVSYGVNKLIGV